jgi:hypothetical protein
VKSCECLFQYLTGELGQTRISHRGCALGEKVVLAFADYIGDHYQEHNIVKDILLISSENMNLHFRDTTIIVYKK